ncbi:ABC transporter permease [Sulfurovum sp.]|uniref:ABC transporter permease n=1 Tax=Sulfurovum sp. TaxID=1969726 RepID=UPI0025DB022D|nr:ABC transporter permease [Sulfurovum sp.]
MRKNKKVHCTVSKLKRGLVLWLSMKDLWHEKLITINLILGTAAIIAPLLILFGIKFGTIEMMTNRLVNDPKNLEIRPLSSRSYTPSWFEKIKKNDKVDFVIPMTRQLSSSAVLQPLSSPEKKITADIVATDRGDPLLLQNGAVIPDENSCVLSQSLAEELGLKRGDKVKCTVARYVKKKIQRASITLKVAAVLSPRAGFIKHIYVPLDIVANIEKYKDGLAVPKWGWKGNISQAYPVYDGVFISVPKSLDRVEQIKLLSGTGFAYINAIDPKKAKERAGYAFDNTQSLYFIRPYKNSVNNDHIGSLKIKLRGKKAKLYPWIKPLNAVIKNNKKEIKVKIVALPKSVKKIKPITLYMSSPPFGKGEMTVKAEKKALTMPISILPMKEEYPLVFIDSKTAGILALLRQRNLTYNQSTHQFILSRRGYASFRIYAKTLEDVAVLKKFFENQGIMVSTQAERIHEVRELDKYLTLIFWLIAIVGVIGGAATLSASLYSSVERKRKELSILRLIGLSGAMIFRFPIYQGIVIASSGVVVALLFFAIMATVINKLFQAHLQSGESFCTLTSTHIAMVFAAAVLLAVVASGIAAYKATKTDPAEAMRDE